MKLKHISSFVFITLFCFFIAACGEEPTQLPPSTPSASPSIAASLTNPTPTVGILSLPSGQALDSSSFANCDFRQLWEYSDRLLTEPGSPSPERTFTWGPHSFGAFEEPYAEASAGKRLVQYFDKGRMEVEPGLPGTSGKVSFGLLSKELISGQIQLGNSTFENRLPSQLPVVGDAISNNPAPSYASLRKVTSLLADENVASDKTGQLVTQALDAEGVVSSLSASTLPAQVTLGSYVASTSHNIPLVFLNYQNISGRVWWNNSRYIRARLFPDNQITQIFGLPLSEPYWVRSMVGQSPKDILVQVFERRILTYTPSNPDLYKVEMGNLGQHYYEWRYAASPANVAPPPYQGSCGDKDLTTLPPLTNHEEIYMPSLMFHQIRDEPDDPYSNSPQFLTEVLDWLQANNYNPVTVGQVADFLREGTPLPPSPVILRFDDGWKSQLFAAEEMQKRFMTATFFVMTDAPGPYLYGEDFVKLEKMGFEIAAHTRTHPMLTRISNPKNEIEGNKQDLEKLLGHPVRSFAYPYGLYSDKIIDMVKAANFDIGVSVDQGAVWRRKTMYTEPNITMEGLTTLDGFIRRLKSVH